MAVHETATIINVATALRSPCFTIFNRAEIKAAVLEALASGARNVVLDFHGITYIDSPGLGVLVALRSQARRNFKAEFSLTRVSRELRAFLVSTKVDGLLPVKDRLPSDGPVIPEEYHGRE